MKIPSYNRQNKGGEIMERAKVKKEKSKLQGFKQKLKQEIWLGRHLTGKRHSQRFQPRSRPS